MLPEGLANFVQHVVNGLSTSSIYVLLGVGLTLIFGLSRLINFAHGQFLVLGSFITWQMTEWGWTFALAALAAVIVVGVIGVALDRTLFQRTVDRPMNGFVASLGVAIALQAIMVKIWSADIYQIPKPVSGVWRLGGVNISRDRVLVLVVAAVAVFFIFLLLDRSPVGRALQAAAENRDAARLVGIDVNGAIATSFLLGSAMAALGGALIGFVFPFTAFSGGTLLIKGFAVALLGGLGNVRGAAIAGVVLGMAESLGGAYGITLFGVAELGPEWADGYAFILLVALLAWRPQGVFRAESRV
ncbi:MAG: branched-chain amino acid ABC transporter permease [Acidimicrobiia bacterium]